MRTRGLDAVSSLPAPRCKSNSPHTRSTQATPKTLAGASEPQDLSHVPANPSPLVFFLPALLCSAPPSLGCCPCLTLHPSAPQPGLCLPFSALTSLLHLYFFLYHQFFPVISCSPCLLLSKTLARTVPVIFSVICSLHYFSLSFTFSVSFTSLSQLS